MNWELLGIVVFFLVVAHGIWIRFFKTKVEDWNDNKTYVQYDNDYCWARQEYDSGRLNKETLAEEIVGMDSSFNKGANKFLRTLKEKTCV